MADLIVTKIEFVSTGGTQVISGFTNAKGAILLYGTESDDTQSSYASIGMAFLDLTGTCSISVSKNASSEKSRHRNVRTSNTIFGFDSSLSLMLSSTAILTDDDLTMVFANHTTALRFQLIVFSGDGVSAAATSDTWDADVSGLSFQPNLAFVSSINSLNNTTAASEIRMGIAAEGASLEQVGTYNGYNAQDSKFGAEVCPKPTTDSTTLTFVAFTSDGINTTGPASGIHQTGLLVDTGGDVNIDILSATSSSTTEDLEAGFDNVAAIFGLRAVTTNGGQNLAATCFSFSAAVGNDAFSIYAQNESTDVSGESEMNDSQFLKGGPSTIGMSHCTIDTVQRNSTLTWVETPDVSFDYGILYLEGAPSSRGFLMM